MPPIAGLQLIWPTVSQFVVSRAVLAPSRAAASAASAPACPAPTTITSYSYSLAAMPLAYRRVARWHTAKRVADRSTGSKPPEGKKVDRQLSPAIELQIRERPSQHRHAF